MPLNLSQQPDGQLVEPPVESSQQPVNESVSSEQEPREVTLETNITPKHKPMPMSLKRKLAELSYNRIPSLSNVVQRKSNSMRIISNSRNNDPDSLKSVNSQAFNVGSCITSTQNNYFEPSSLGSLSVLLTDSVNRQSSNIPSSLGSLSVVLTDSVNTQPSNNPTSSESIYEPLTDSLENHGHSQQSNHRNSLRPLFLEFARVSTSRGHMRVRRASSEISDSSVSFIQNVFVNDDIISGNASYSSGREHSNVAAPSRISEHIMIILSII